MAIHMGYRQTEAVYTRRSGSVQIQPDRPTISVSARIGSNSRPDWVHCWACAVLSDKIKLWVSNIVLLTAIRCLHCMKYVLLV